MNEWFSREHLRPEISDHSATTLQRGRPEAVAPFRPVLIFRLEVDLRLLGSTTWTSDLRFWHDLQLKGHPA